MIVQTAIDGQMYYFGGNCMAVKMSSQDMRRGGDSVHLKRVTFLSIYCIAAI